MRKVISLFLCTFLVFSIVPSNNFVFADTPSFELVGVRGELKVVSSELKGGKMNIIIESTNDDIITYWKPQNQLVSDCSFLQPMRIYTMGDKTTDKTFELNINRNGTYAFYVFKNGNKLVGYVHYRIKGFAQDDIPDKDLNSGKYSKMSKDRAEEFGLSHSEGEIFDFDGATNGFCRKQNNEEDRPSGGQYDEQKPQEPSKPSDGGSSNKVLEDALEKIKNAVNEISKNTSDISKNTGEISKNTKEISDAIKEIKDNLKIPDDMDLTIKPIDSNDIRPDKPNQPDKPFEDKQEHFKESDEDKGMPEKLPKTPEPADCWGDVCKDKENEKEKDMSTEKPMEKEEMKPEKPMEKEEMKPEKPMEKEEMKPEKPM
ncbi:hypothetical protein M3215_22725, partial [Bacillus cytotoxicus]|nr:hypothetical protein [Bacillus cytotoxicus]